MTSSARVRHAALSGVILLSGCLLLAACSGNSGGSASSSPISAGQPAMAPGSSGGSLGSAPGSHQAAVQTAGLAPASRSIIYTASLSIRSGNVAATAKRAIGIVEAAGGYVSDEHATSSAGKSAGATISLALKVPVPSYQAALGQLSSPAIGKQLSMQQQAIDVTQQVADVNSLVTSEQDAIAALQGLLKRAASVSGLLQVQQQISQDESTLNSLLSQQRALDHETSYATVTMMLVSPKHAAAHKTTTRGFLAGLAAGWRALKHATALALTALGAALPFLIVLIVLGGVGYLAWRRFGGRPAVTPKPTDSAG